MSEGLVKLCDKMDSVLGNASAEIADLRARLQTAEQQLADTQREFGRIQGTSAKQVVDRFLDLMRKLNEKDLPAGFESWEAYGKHIDGIKQRAVAAEQQLGQVREEVKVLRSALRIDEPWALWHVINSLCDAVDFAFHKYDMRPDGWEAWSHNAKVGREIAAQLGALSATPSDGYGKGRMDKERLDWLEAQKIVRLSYFFMRPSWEVDSIQTDEPLEVSGESLRAAIDKAMEAASSKGKDGGE